MELSISFHDSGFASKHIDRSPSIITPLCIWCVNNWNNTPDGNNLCGSAAYQESNEIKTPYVIILFMQLLMITISIVRLLVAIACSLWTTISQLKTDRCSSKNRHHDKTSYSQTVKLSWYARLSFSYQDTSMLSNKSSIHFSGMIAFPLHHLTHEKEHCKTPFLGLNAKNQPMMIVRQVNSICFKAVMMLVWAQLTIAPSTPIPLIQLIKLAGTIWSTMDSLHMCGGRRTYLVAICFIFLSEIEIHPSMEGSLNLKIRR